ncbi:MAG: hypothetical protein JW809_05545 [Pirellulales bacterium]|nr:hypothetical protein [Pirellulales bacterium]
MKRHATSVFAAIAIWPLVLASGVAAQEGRVAADARTRRETAIVLRISLELFDDLTKDEFDEDLTVQTRILGADVRGTARAVGRVTVEPETSPQEAAFVIKVAGEARSQTVASQGPVRAFSRGTTKFEARKRIRFDGRAFHAEKTEARVEHRASIERVATSFNGLVGRVVQRLACHHIGQVRRRAERIVAADTEADIVAQFDDIGEDLVAELNETSKLEQTVAQLFPEAKSWEYRLTATDRYLQAAVGPEGCAPPTLPVAADDVTDAPVEVWIRTTSASAALVDTLRAWNQSHHQLRTYLPIPESDEARLVDNAQAIAVGPWVVVAVGETVVEAAARLQGKRKTAAASRLWLEGR